MIILELAYQIGIHPKRAASTYGGEYHSSCPVCGGSDRFYIQPHRQMSKCLGYYRCRQCGITGDTIQFARQFLGYSFQEAAQAANAVIPEKIIPPIFSTRAPRPISLQKPSEEWIAQATTFITQAHKNLLYKPEVLSYLAARGLPIDAVIRYKLGWSTRDEFFSKVSWRINEQSESDGKQHPLWIPKGLVIPTIESSGKVMRLKVRRHDWHKNDTLPKYVAVSGSMNGLSIIGSSKQAILAVVESELDAYAIDHATRDFVCAIAVGSNTKNPDNVADRLARNAKHLLICHDNDTAGNQMLIKWQRMYSHAKSYPAPTGKDIGEYIQAGGDIRRLFSEKFFSNS